jgi:hypothetical protein
VELAFSTHQNPPFSKEKITLFGAPYVQLSILPTVLTDVGVPNIARTEASSSEQVAGWLVMDILEPAGVVFGACPQALKSNKPMSKSFFINMSPMLKEYNSTVKESRVKLCL